MSLRPAPGPNPGPAQHSAEYATRGQIVKRPVVVTGAPGSGKSAWVKAIARPGDLVWDADAVAAAIADEPEFPRSPHVAIMLARLREAFVQGVLSLPAVSAYVIVSDEPEALALAERMEARLQRCDGQSEKRERIERDAVSWG